MNDAEMLAYFGFDIRSIRARALRRLRDKLAELPGMDAQRQRAIAAINSVIAAKQEVKPETSVK